MFRRALPLVALVFIACGDGGDQFENYCVGVDCGNHGQCAVGADGPVCICDKGFTEQDGVCKQSQVDNPCDGVTCGGHGVCIVTASDEALCDCEQGYDRDGTDCVATPEPCLRFDCGANASCLVTPTNEPICVCNEGYHREGDNCVLTANPCVGFDCGENGRCALGADGPMCVCSPGFTLQDDVCVPTPGDNPCADIKCAGAGVCAIAHNNTAVCYCRPGYYADGAKCIAGVAEGAPCADITCGGNGSCVVTGDNAPLCICDEGYHHDDNNCVPSPSPCSKVNCGDHGRCAVGTDGPFCVCDLGFTLQGDTCQETPNDNPCEGIVCAGEGVCAIAHGNTAVCYCRPGYFSDGAKCVKGEVTASACAEFNCGSNASCVVTAANKPLCICDEGYRREGSNCVKGDVDTSVKMNVCSNGWCLIPAGTFQMGAPADEACRWKEEGPAHPVTISRPFLMKQTEVTQKEWRDVIGNNPSDKQNCDDCPVEKVSWYDAVYYANKLSGEHGLETCYTLTNETGSAGTGDYSATVTF